MAAATITFDNSEGWLPIDYAEVSIGRRAHRDGQNEYLLNGQRVRLRDIQELLANGGLAETKPTPSSARGLVDSVLSLRVEERSKLFEEAAGITIPPSQGVMKSLRRLEKTKLNLDRVKDVLSEIRPRLKSLERQAEQAEAYDLVLDDLKRALEKWYGHHWYLLHDGLHSAKSEAEIAAQERDELLSETESATRLLHEASETGKRTPGAKNQPGHESETSSNAAGDPHPGSCDSRNSDWFWLQDEERSFDGEIVGLETAKTDVGDRLVQAKEEASSKARTQSLPGFIQARSEAQAEQERSKLKSQQEQLEDQLLGQSQKLATLEAKLEGASKAVLDSDQFVQRMQEAAHRGALPGLVGDLGAQPKGKGRVRNGNLGRSGWLRSWNGIQGLGSGRVGAGLAYR